MAYRSRKDKRRAETATDGLVVEMVQQFADKYAFVRELVQNGIDAGASEIHVVARYLGGAAVFEVRDDGEGMTREIIEGPLLTLFNSAKDQDNTKIGKYGVGFVSVFAIDPDEVVVDTWRGGESWSLSLRPDHSYELASTEPLRDGRTSGTTVSLHKSMNREAFRADQQQVHDALVRWCRHARLPVHFRVDEEGSEPRSVRVDRPLAVASPVMVEAHLDGMHIVVGPGVGDADAATFAGFYNHGLTLFETNAPRRHHEGIRYKVDSPALSHTLSRDNVRHDAAFDLALRRVTELIRTTLRREVVQHIADAAAQLADGDAFAALVMAACLPALDIRAKELVVPLCDRVDGAVVLPASKLARDGTVLYEPEPSKMTHALAKRGRPVLRANWPLEVLDTLALEVGCAIFAASSAYTLLTPLSAKRARKADVPLQALVKEMMEVAGEPADEVAFATSDGARLDTAGVRVTSAREPQLISAYERSALFRLSRPRARMLLVEHDAVAAARDLAGRDVRAAAHLLARFLIVEARGEIDKRDNDALLAAAGGLPS